MNNKFVLYFVIFYSKFIKPQPELKLQFIFDSTLPSTKKIRTTNLSFFSQIFRVNVSDLTNIYSSNVSASSKKNRRGALNRVYTYERRANWNF